ncbi:MAG TPA: PIG-L family deacetylase [Bryobacteraceae bacterium]|nr:PIG-L family deacetylase [Bryobacteraceae bacterium]
MWQEIDTGSAGIERPLDILAIAAHPDDVEQTCGGTLIRMSEQGYRTGVLDLTAGDMGSRGTPELRIAESEAAACAMRLAWRGNLRLPDARHPDHYRAQEIGFEACFLSGLRKLDENTEPHRPHKILYSSLYANVTPSFVVDISAQFERRMSALFSYESQYGKSEEASELFPDQAEIRERLGSIARFYGNLIGVKYGEPFVVKETMRVDDITAMGVRSL